MAAVVATHAVEQKAAGIAADLALPLDRNDFGLPASREKERGTDSGGAGAENQHGRTSARCIRRTRPRHVCDRVYDVRSTAAADDPGAAVFSVAGFHASCASTPINPLA